MPHDPRMKGETLLEGACICCGGDIPVKWNDEMSRFFALAADVCPACYAAGCSGISLAAEVRKCYVTGRDSCELWEDYTEFVVQIKPRAEETT